MEDISIIKKKTFELKQYANAILGDLDINLSKERKNYKTSIYEITESKDKMIDQLKGAISTMDGEIATLKNENCRLNNTVKNIKGVIGSAIKICEGAE